MSPTDLVHFAKTLVEEIDAQDNRATASPYYFILQEKKEVAAYPGCGHIAYVDEDGDSYRRTALIDVYKDYMEEGHADPWGRCQCDEDRIEAIICTLNLREVEVTEEWVDQSNTFLTEKAAEDHIAANHYHWGEVRTYVKHFWRNREMEGVMKVLRAVADGSLLGEEDGG